MFIRALALIFLLLGPLPFTSPVAAQSFPVGSCVLPSGQWCVPPQISTPGSACACPTMDGWVYGIQN